MHYTRWRRFGSVMAELPAQQERPILWRVLSRCEIGDCWIWVGAKNDKGYGMIGVGGRPENGGRKKYVHRAVWEELVGPIADGLHIDHLCFNPPCVNPEHLRPVTQAINSQASARKLRWCRAGRHEMIGANLYISPGGKRRMCRGCMQDRRKR